MSEMVERVARIMARQDGMKETDDWSEWAPGALERAREIILSMREPTEAMTKAANEAALDKPAFSYPIGGTPLTGLRFEVHAKPEEYWRAMVDASIGPPSPSDAPG